MADNSDQNYKNHAKYVTGYHFVLLPMVLVIVLYCFWQVISDFSFDHVIGLLVGISLFIISWYVRAFALQAQDRLIRLEMELRLQKLLPGDLQGRLQELRRGQWIALRFASDEELPGLVRDVLDGKLKTATEIKKTIQHWQADHWRL